MNYSLMVHTLTGFKLVVYNNQLTELGHDKNINTRICFLVCSITVLIPLDLKMFTIISQ